jgi:BMFP domain-containing protein YqiC
MSWPRCHRPSAFLHWQTQQIERLSARVAELEAHYAKNATNSSKPPSTEHPHAKTTTAKPKGQRKPVKRRLGHDLMRPTRAMFAWWQKVRDGTLSREEFQGQMQPLRHRVESVLLRGYLDRRVRGFCTDLYEHRERLWLFVAGEHLVRGGRE